MSGDEAFEQFHEAREADLMLMQKRLGTDIGISFKEERRLAWQTSREQTLEEAATIVKSYAHSKACGCKCCELTAAAAEILITLKEPTP